MALEQYRKVIARVIASNPGAEPAALADEIIRTVKVAMMIADDIDLPPAPSTTSPVRMQTLAKPLIQTPEREFGASALIIGEAPPSTAGFSSERKQAAIDYHTQEELAALVAANMPAALTLQIPGVPVPVVVNRRIQQPALALQAEAGKDTVTSFVRLSYVVPGQEDGPAPTVQIMTTEKSPNWPALKNDIAEQARLMFSKEPRKVVARPEAPYQFTDADLKKMEERDRAANPNGREVYSEEAQKDAAYFRQQAGRT